MAPDSLAAPLYYGCSARASHVRVASRNPDAARSALGADPELVALDGSDRSWDAAVANRDAVVHLAGENLFSGRWTASKKAELVRSRVAHTQQLVRAIERSPRGIQSMVSASAVGFYGPRDDTPLDEQASAGTDFLAQLCADWEAAARGAESLGVRVVTPRIGVVLGAEGGALGRMLPPFRAGAGGRLGSGSQWMSWIHLDDLIEALVFALRTDSLRGAVNAVAPEPVTNKHFTRSLGSTLKRPTILPVPAPMLRLALGEAAGVLLTGQRVLPAALESAGFSFRFGDLRSALEELTAEGQDVTIGPARDVPDHAYTRQRRPRYLLEQETIIDRPLEEVFAFFSKSANLGAMTPPSMSFKIMTPAPIVMAQGTQIDYRVGVGPLPLPWRTIIESWEPGKRFVDAQYRGPYRSWFHEHSFRAEGTRTVMRDRVWYAPPLGPLGALPHALFIGSKLRSIFNFRTRAIRWRFGTA